MQTKKVLLFGGSGFLGSYLKHLLSIKTLLSPSHKELDLLEINGVYHFIEKNEPETIIYAAGITKIDFAQRNRQLTDKLNRIIPQKIANFAAKHTIHFIYISTDAVFDGYKNKFAFSEEDTPKAKSSYGISKLKGENSVLSVDANNTIIRLITLYGIDRVHENFVLRILNDLKNNRPVLGIIDQIQNPLLINTAASAIAYITNEKLPGIYHLGATDYATNYHFLVTLAEKFIVDTSLIKKITYKDFFKEKNNNRKQKSVLLCDKFKNISQNKILRTIDSSLTYLHELNPHFLSK